jgi:Amt family ammonium transporter
VALTFAFVFVASLLTFAAIKAVFGLRVTEEEEDAGLDIAEHGMYGYPEQFIPAPELIGYANAPSPRDVPTGAKAPSTREVTA